MSYTEWIITCKAALARPALANGPPAANEGTEVGRFFNVIIVVQFFQTVLLFKDPIVVLLFMFNNKTLFIP